MSTDEWKHWADFFTVLTPVAATILGLLFVGLQIAVTTWELAPLRQAAAYRHLLEIATPVGIGLVALLPGGRWWLGGYIGGGIGVVSVVLYWLAFAVLSSSPKNGYDFFEILLSLLSVAMYGGILRGSWLNDVNTVCGIQLVGWLCLWFVMAGVTQSWMLLVVKAPGGGDPVAKAEAKAKKARD